MDKEIYEIKHNIEQYINTILCNTDKELIPTYSDKKKILVLSGGGIKGIAHIGALQRLYELGHIFEKFIGTSVGGLLIALLVVGYTPKELWDFIQTFDLSKIVSLNILDINSKLGIDDGSKIEFVISSMISNKNIDPQITLNNLYKKTGKYLIFSGVSINEQSIYYISHKTFPNMPLLTAIRITICIPIYFVPIKYIHNGKILYFVDGGCMDNYPIHLCKNKMSNVLGLYIHKNIDDTYNMQNFSSYVMLVFETFMSGIDKSLVRGYDDNTINIFIDNINSIDFNIDISKKIKLYQDGYDAIKKKLG
jgi:NTE family protein